MAYFETQINTREEIITNITARLSAAGWVTEFSGDAIAANALDTRVGQVRVMRDAEGNFFTFWNRTDDLTYGGYIPTPVVQGMLYSRYDSALDPFSQVTNTFFDNEYGQHEVNGLDNNGAVSTSTTWLNRTFNFCGTDGEPTYLWLFTGPTYCHAVWQSDAGRYHHFNFGTIRKGYPFNGGAFMSGSWRSFLDSSNYGRNPDSDNNCAPFNQIRDGSAYQRGRDMFMGDFDGQVARMCRAHSSGSHDTHELGLRGALIGNSHRLNVPPHTSRTVLIPMWVAIRNTSTNDAVLPGTIPEARRANIANHQPAEQLIYEGETWRIFPWSIKATAYSTSTGVMGNTYIYAVAYKE